MEAAPAAERGEGTTPPVADGEHIQAVLAFWSAFDLDGRRAKLDNKALEMKEAREASQRSRKGLAERTKEFRRMSDSEKLATTKDLLKAYQEEIDALTKRARASDSAFFALYKDLYEAPDPGEALRGLLAARPRAAHAQLEVQKLQAEIDEYEKEFKELKNQDITIRKLQEEIEELEEQMDVRVSEETEAKRAEMEADFNKRVEEAMEREVGVERKLQGAEDALSEAKHQAERTQAKIFEVTRQAEESAAAFQAEIRILSESVEKHEAVCASLERENNMLRARLEAEAGSGGVDLGSSPPSSPGGRLASSGAMQARVQQLDAEVLELRSANARLNKEVVAMERKATDLGSALVEVESQLRSEVETLEASKAALTAELSGRPSTSQVDELRRQLRTLQQLEFNLEEEDSPRGTTKATGGVSSHGGVSTTGEKYSVGDGSDGSRGGSGSGPVKVGAVSGKGAGVSDVVDEAANPEDTSSMEKVLLARLRRVENSAVSTKRALRQSEEETALLKHDLAKSKAQLGEKSELIRRLEGDLLAHSSSPVRRTARPLGSGLLDRLVTPVGVDSASDEIHGGNEMVEDAGQAQAQGGGDMLSIVQAQRDRFIRRIKDLEEERATLTRHAGQEKQAAEQLQRDNLKLYEKIRYLQSYSARAASSPALRALEPRGDLEAGGTEAKYKSIYDAQNNPFTQFSQMERQRRYGELSVAEKITLNTTRMFLSSKFARTFVFFYVIGLHALFCAAIMHWAHTGSCSQQYHS